MSVIRNSSTRSDARKINSSPYGFTSIFTKIKKLFRAADGESLTADEPNSSPSSFSSPGGVGSSSSQQHHFSRHERYQQPTSSHDRPPLSPVNHLNNAASSSSQTFPPISNDNSYRAAPSVASQTFGTQVAPAAMQNFHSNVKDTLGHESFRFSSTPPRQISNNTSTSNAPRPASSRRAKLSKNPNGAYLWEGGGSAKKNNRPRNRFASPAFGASPGKLSTSRDLTSTDKRRRIDESAASDSSRNVAPLPFPITASPSAPQSPSKAPHRPPVVTTAPPRLRTPVKPTTPVVPSPLRQAWSDVSPTSSPKEDTKQHVQSSKQTQTATMMAELIKESAPPKKPDLSNPYQTASPVGKVGPPRRSARRPRATNRAPVHNKTNKDEGREHNSNDEKEKETATAQAIIEATLPKGSKRSRPPAGLEKAEPSKQAYVVEEVEDDQEPSSKRSKPSLEGRGIPPFARTTPDSVVIEDLDDDVTMAGLSHEKTKPKAEPPKLTVPTNVPASRSFKSAAPKEPSKLRYSIQADTPPSPIPAPSVSSPPVYDSSAPSFNIPTSEFSFTVNPSQETGFGKASLPAKEKEVAKEGLSDEEAKNNAKEAPVSSLPVFVLTASSVSVLPRTPEHVDARNAALKAPIASLPTFDLVGPAKSSSPFTFVTNQAPPKPIVQAFNWGALGKAPPSSSKGMKKCSECGLDNPLSVDECTICNNPMPVDTPSAPAKDTIASSPAPPVAPESKPIVGFNWAAIGKAPPSASQGNTMCGTCGLSTPASKPECTICGSAM